MRIHYVYMHNSTNSDDDEVFKVKAENRKEAIELATKCQRWAGRFSIGSVWTVSECPKEYKWWAHQLPGEYTYAWRSYCG